jgi:hypothetical protein
VRTAALVVEAVGSISRGAAFCSDSLKVRPMAIASPDFIWVVRMSGVVNFSR